MRRKFLHRSATSTLHALALTAFPSWLGLARAQPQGSLFTFGVVPQQSASELARAWIPLLGLLAQRATLSLRFATAPDIPTFEKRLAAGQYDFAYMNPYHYTVFSQVPGYRAFAKEKNRRLRGLVVVRKDSTLQSLTGLAGQEVAFPAPAAFAATVLVRAELKRQGINIKPRYVGSHDSVYLNVAKGVSVAGGGITRTLEGIEPEVRNSLRVLWTTQAYTPHAIAAHPRVAADAVAALKAAMLSADGDEAGVQVLKGVGFTGIDAAADAEWNDVRALGIDVLANLLKG